MDADVATLAEAAMDPRWGPAQRRLLKHLAATFPAATPPPVRVRVWESTGLITGGEGLGRELNVAFDHPDEPLWHVELLIDESRNCQVWLLADDTHLDFLQHGYREPEQFIDDLLSGALTFTVTHYAGRAAHIAANRPDIDTSFLVPPANVGLRRRLSVRRRTQTLRWTGDEPVSG